MEFEEIVMEEPSWELSIPSPARMTPVIQNTSNENQCSNPGLLEVNNMGISYCMIENCTPLSGKNGLVQNDITPQSTTLNPPKTQVINSSGHSNASDTINDMKQCSELEFKLSRRFEIPRVFVQMRTCSPVEFDELNASVIAIIEKSSDTYVCIHDVVDMVAKELGRSNKQLKWRHFDDYTFLYPMANKVSRDRFGQMNSNMFFGDAAVTFKAWQPTTGPVKKPCRFKVWLRLCGLPLEYFNFSTTELVVSSFGRLQRCNMEKKKSFIGAFYVMIECDDLDEVKPRVVINLTNGYEMPVFIGRLYACSSDVYNNHLFPQKLHTYDEVLNSLMEGGELIVL